MPFAKTSSQRLDMLMLGNTQPDREEGSSTEIVWGQCTIVKGPELALPEFIGVLFNSSQIGEIPVLQTEQNNRVGRDR